MNLKVNKRSYIIFSLNLKNIKRRHSICSFNLKENKRSNIILTFDLGINTCTSARKFVAHDILLYISYYHEQIDLKLN